MSMQQYGYDNGYGGNNQQMDRDRRHHHGHRGNEMEPFFGGGFVDPIRTMARDLARMENMMFGGFGGQNVGSMVDRSLRTMPNFIERDGQQLAQFQFDVKGFRPDDITIKTNDGVVTVTARHEDKGEDHVAIREFRRMVAVPPGMQIDAMKSRLAPNGVLSLEAPYQQPTNKDGDHYEIPIQHDTSSSNKGKR
ncbi:HSP20-1 [Ramazzottius varieornatus]|uniref:HSP20-1 n=1 Tax=Ramazzottius varieornatus TaxID=947166 RepID=A0A1D1UF75_RAMVA|nr:HSP20-1 [Ramazzottius varieornatus]